eukprot:6268552-Alexandrium_andersonii.AAC.1
MGSSSTALSSAGSPLSLLDLPTGSGRLLPRRPVSWSAGWGWPWAKAARDRLRARASMRTSSTAP